MTRIERPPAPKRMDIDCPECEDETPHDVIKGTVIKGGRGVQGTFSCRACGDTRNGTILFPAAAIVPLIVSYDERSARAQVEIPEGERVEVGDEFLIDDETIEVTSIELKDQGRRTKWAHAEDVATLWGKNVDHVKVKFGINKGQRTRSFSTWFEGEDDISIGESFDLDGEEVFVDRIVTDEGPRHEGRVNVRRIKRVWLRPPATRRAPERPKANRAARGTDGHDEPAPAGATHQTGAPTAPTSAAPPRTGPPSPDHWRRPAPAGPGRGGPRHGRSTGQRPTRGRPPTRRAPGAGSSGDRRRPSPGAGRRPAGRQGRSDASESGERSRSPGRPSGPASGRGGSRGGPGSRGPRSGGPRSGGPHRGGRSAGGRPTGPRGRSGPARSGGSKPTSGPKRGGRGNRRRK